jgi:hypothetical protein
MVEGPGSAAQLGHEERPGVGSNGPPQSKAIEPAAGKAETEVRANESARVADGAVKSSEKALVGSPRPASAIAQAETSPSPAKKSEGASVTHGDGSSEQDITFERGPDGHHFLRLKLEVPKEKPVGKQYYAIFIVLSPENGLVV